MPSFPFEDVFLSNFIENMGGRLSRELVNTLAQCGSAGLLPNCGHPPLSWQHSRPKRRPWVLCPGTEGPLGPAQLRSSCREHSLGLSRGGVGACPGCTRRVGSRQHSTPFQLPVLHNAAQFESRCESADTENRITRNMAHGIQHVPVKVWPGLSHIQSPCVNVQIPASLSVFNPFLLELELLHLIPISLFTSCGIVSWFLIAWLRFPPL